ncbi:uncharacterized protein LOC105638418 [Jatropha curcas]|uniref:uncharacterized protein LOC105638418 n=1 Tax=Jatropha curcas TaxID=180498 RepID=UPI0005FB048F|nr:uncharacterized protein LOC105638418 [Jatropha curcas]
MYPKVKVRRDEDQKDQRNWSSLLSLKDIQFLLLQDSCFPVKEFQDVSPTPTARIPKSYVPNIVLPAESASEGADKKGDVDEENRPKIRASSVPRPRAVISSPDNDAVIGNKNKPKALKNHNSIQNRHTHCKVVQTRAVDESPLNTRKSNNNTDRKFDLKGKKGPVPGPATAISSQRRNLTANKKPSSLRI